VYRLNRRVLRRTVDVDLAQTALTMMIFSTRAAN
jgi:hypothetical protein